MKEKKEEKLMGNNRFSILLEGLMEIADLKNVTLAQELQYDVSYISKWINGRTLPSEKGLEKILHGISKCIVDSLQKENLAQLYKKYNVFCEEHLEMAIYENLLIEYNYVKELKVDTGLEVTPQIAYFPELTLLQFVTKMRHPVLRNVQSLDVVTMMDLFAMEKNCQAAVLELQQAGGDSMNYFFPGVHFSMLLDTSIDRGNVLRNVELLLNMINNFSTVNFDLYESKQAIGKAIFAVESGFTISGMMTDSNHCIAVTTSENAEISSTMYHKLKSFCTHNNQLLEHATMRDFLQNNNYMKAILAEWRQWFISFMTEHFLTDELFEEILMGLPEKDLSDEIIAMLRKNHSLLRNILEGTQSEIVIYDSALQNLMVSGELCFYHSKVILNTDQRIRYLAGLLELLDRNPNFKLRIINYETVPKFQLFSTPNIFCTESITYVHLINCHEGDRLEILRKYSISRMFHEAFSLIWNYLGEASVNETRRYIEQISRSLYFLSKTEKMGK